MNFRIPKKDYFKMEEIYINLGSPLVLRDLFQPILDGAEKIRKIQQKKSKGTRLKIQKKIMDLLPDKFTHRDLRNTILKIVKSTEGKPLTMREANKRAHSYGWQLSHRDKKLIVTCEGKTKIYSKNSSI